MLHYFQQYIAIRGKHNETYYLFLHDFSRHVFERKWQGPLKVSLISIVLVANRPIIRYL